MSSNPTRFTPMSDTQINSGVEGISQWVDQGINLQAINFAEKFGDHLANLQKDALTTAQIRNVFGEVRRIQMNGYSESSVLMLLPKLAYAAKRANTKGARQLAKVLSPGLRTVVEGKNTEEKEERFENFANFFEAVLAYHKAKGGN